VGYGWRSAPDGIRAQSSCSLVTFNRAFRRVPAPPPGPDEIWITGIPGREDVFLWESGVSAKSAAIAGAHRKETAVRYVRARMEESE